VLKFDDYNWNYIDECLLDSYKESIERISKKEKALNLEIHENCYMLPLRKRVLTHVVYEGGILDSNKNFIETAKMLPNRIYNGYDFDSKTVNYDDREVIFAGYFLNHWGHFILEHVSRLWYFLNEKDTSLPIVYLGDRKLQGSYLEFFELLGINADRLVWVDKITKFRKIHIPDVSMVAMDYYTNEYAKIFEKIRAGVSKDNNYPKKIFFTRRNLTKATITDFGAIKEIEDFFENNGYTLISPEKLSLKEQIKYLKSCEEYACVSGTLPHNLLFADNNIKSIILNKSYGINPHQPLIEKVRGITPLYIDTHVSILPENIGLGPFFFSFSENLIKWGTDNNLNYIPCSNDKYLPQYLKGFLKTPPNIKRRFWIFKNLNIKYRNYYLTKFKHKNLIKLLLKIFPIVLAINELSKTTDSKFHKLILIIQTKCQIL